MEVQIETNLYRTLLSVQHSEKFVRSQIPIALRNIMAFAKDRWSQYADQHLSPETAKLYKAAISKDPRIDEQQLIGSVEMDGKVALMLEEGFASYDLKPLILKGKKFKDVGFKHLGSGPRAMPKNVYSDMQKVIRKAEAAGAFQRSKTLPGFQEMRVRGRNYPPSKSTHATGIHSAMLSLVTKSPRGAKYSSFSTIRRVSENSDPQSWIHPGFKGVHAANLIQRDIESTLPRVIAQALGAKGQAATVLSFEEK